MCYWNTESLKGYPKLSYIQNARAMQKILSVVLFQTPECDLSLESRV